MWSLISPATAGGQGSGRKPLNLVSGRTDYPGSKPLACFSGAPRATVHTGNCGRAGL